MIPARLFRLPESFVAKIPSTGILALIEMGPVMDVKHSCQHSSSPGRLPPDVQPGYFHAARLTLWAPPMYTCNPQPHTRTNRLRLEAASTTFLWEMKISGGAEQPILDSVVN